MKNFLSLLLALVMCLGLFAGCASEPATTPDAPAADTPATEEPAEEPTDAPAEESADAPAEEPTEETDSVYPLCTDGSLTLSIMLPLTAHAPGTMNDYLDGTNLVWPVAIEKTGVNLEMDCIANSSYQEQSNLAIVSQQLDDIMQVMGYAGGMDQAYDDGLFVELNGYEDIMPNYMSFVNMSEANVKASMSDGGHRMGMSQVAESTKPMTAGMFIRQDWLDQLDLEMPTTNSEWHDVLAAFRDEITGGEAPLSFPNDGFTLGNFFSGVFGVTGGLNSPFVNINGTITYCPSMDGFREYIEMIRDWYAEGLIDPEYMTKDGVQFTGDMDRIAANVVGATPITISMGGSFFYDIGILPEGAYYAMAPMQTLEDGSLAPVQPVGKYSATVGNGGWMFSADGEHIEEAIKFIDYFYSPEGVLLTNYGIEGVTFEYDENGTPRHTDMIANNPEYSQMEAQEIYLIHNFFCLSVEREFSSISDEGMKCWDLWNTPGEYNMPGISFTAEETVENGSITTDLNTYVSETVTKWITGQETLDDASWEDYINNLQRMNCEDLTENYQAAYDRWLSK